MTNVTPIGLAAEPEETVPQMLRRLADEIESDGHPARAVLILQTYPAADMQFVDQHTVGIEMLAEAVGIMEIGKLNLIKSEMVE